MSRRYVDDEVELYEPAEWRLAADNKKQGSSDGDYINTGCGHLRLMMVNKFYISTTC